MPEASAIDVQGVQLGVIAQEVVEHLPDIVKEESTGCLTVQGDNIKWYLVNAVKELSAELNELKKLASFLLHHLICQFPEPLLAYDDGLKLNKPSHFH